MPKPTAPDGATDGATDATGCPRVSNLKHSLFTPYGNSCALYCFPRLSQEENNCRMMHLATGCQTLQRPASAREASSSRVTGTSRWVARKLAGAASTSPQTSGPLTPSSPHASWSQGGDGISGYQAAPQSRPGASQADALCVSVPRPWTRPAQSGRGSGPVVARPGILGGGGHSATEESSCSLLRTWSCWPIIVRNLRIVGKSKIYENKLKRFMKMCWEYRPVRSSNENTRLLSPNIVWTGFNSILRRSLFPFP